jgi:hypothetical protein
MCVLVVASKALSTSSSVLLLTEDLSFLTQVCEFAFPHELELLQLVCYADLLFVYQASKPSVISLIVSIKIVHAITSRH